MKDQVEVILQILGTTIVHTHTQTQTNHDSLLNPNFFFLFPYLHTLCVYSYVHGKAERRRRGKKAARIYMRSRAVR